jgi:hypothetical protein
MRLEDEKDEDMKDKDAKREMDGSGAQVRVIDAINAISLDCLGKKRLATPAEQTSNELNYVPIVHRKSD